MVNCKGFHSINLGAGGRDLQEGFPGDYHAQRHIDLILEFFGAGLKAILETFLVEHPRDIGQG